MKAILIIEDNPEKPGAIEISVMRIHTPAEAAAGCKNYDTIAGKIMLAVEGFLLPAVHKTHANIAAGSPPVALGDKCLH